MGIPNSLVRVSVFLSFQYLHMLTGPYMSTGSSFLYIINLSTYSLDLLGVVVFDRMKN